MNRCSALFLFGYLYSFFFIQDLIATPLIAIKESNQCGACHTPGRTQKPPEWRRCTLDCQGCHVDPNGGGPRNQWGTYYLNDSLAMDNYFAPQDPLEDQSRWDFHQDTRVLKYRKNQTNHFYPMNSEWSLRIRPFVRWLHLTYQRNDLGGVTLKNYDPFSFDSSRSIEKYSIMIDELPYNIYLRKFRGLPAYGQPRSNHTLWIREKVGLNPYMTTDGLTLGLTPNVPFFHASKIDGNAALPDSEKQKGYSVHSGLRGVSYGWNIHLSHMSTASEYAKIKMSSVGGGFKVLDVVFMTETNLRNISLLDTDSSDSATVQSSEQLGLFPGSLISEHSLAYTGIKGLMFGVVQEKLNWERGNQYRNSFFLDFHPIPYLQIEYWLRKESGAFDFWDRILVSHFYVDF